MLCDQRQGLVGRKTRLWGPGARDKGASCVSEAPGRFHARALCKNASERAYVLPLSSVTDRLGQRPGHRGGGSALLQTAEGTLAAHGVSPPTRPLAAPTPFSRVITAADHLTRGCHRSAPGTFNNHHCVFFLFLASPLQAIFTLAFPCFLLEQGQLPGDRAASDTHQPLHNQEVRALHQPPWELRTHRPPNYLSLALLLRVVIAEFHCWSSDPLGMRFGLQSSAVLITV